MFRIENLKKNISKKLIQILKEIIQKYQTKIKNFMKKNKCEKKQTL